MISRHFKYGFRTGKVGSGLRGSRTTPSTHWSTERPSRGAALSTASGAGGQRTRLLFLCLALACIPVMIFASVKQYRATGALEKKLAAERVCQVAEQLDALVAVRSSAVRMSAGSLELENLSSSAELNKILNNLKELFPDFLSIEICNERGQTVAMMGDLSLAQVGSKGKVQETAKTAMPAPGQNVQFRDEPSEHSFFITLQHRGADGATWFSRSRFSSDSIQRILASDAADHTRLVAVAETEGRPAKEASGARSITAHRDCAVTTDRSWLPRTLAATASLATRGWAITSETTAQGSAFYPIALVASALVVLLCALAGLRLAPQRVEESHLPESPRKDGVPAAAHPEPIAPVPVLQPDKDSPVGKTVSDRLDEPLVPVLPLPEQEPPAFHEDEFFSGYSDAQPPVTETKPMGMTAEPERTRDPNEDFRFGHKLAQAPTEEPLPHSSGFELELLPCRHEETDFGAVDRYWPAVEVLGPEAAEERQEAVQAEEALLMGEVVTEQPAEQLADFDALLPACTTDCWAHDPGKPSDALANASFDSKEADELSPVELPYDADYYAETLSDTQLCYDADIPHAAESDFAAWDAEFPREWDESAVGPQITAQPAEALPTDTVVEAKLEPAPTEPDNSIPDSLEITWFEPASESEEGPAEKEAAPSTEKVNTIRFVSI